MSVSPSSVRVPMPPSSRELDGPLGVAYHAAVAALQRELPEREGALAVGKQPPVGVAGERGSLDGGAAGLGLAYWGTTLLVSAAPPSIPRLNQVRVDGLVLAFTLVIGLCGFMRLARLLAGSALVGGALALTLYAGIQVATSAIIASSTDTTAKLIGSVGDTLSSRFATTGLISQAPTSPIPECV